MDDFEREAQQIYDLEEGEIVEEDDDIGILDGFSNNSFYNNIQDLQTYFTDHNNIPYNYRDRYLNNNFSARHSYEVEQTAHPYSTFRRKESRPVKKYKHLAGNKHECDKRHEKSRSPTNSSSSESTCSCSSCPSSSSDIASPPSSPLPSHPKDGYHYSKSSNKPSHERKEPPLHQRYSPKKEKIVKSTIHVPSKPISKKKNSSDFNKSLQDKIYKHNQRFERRPKSTAGFKRTTSGPSKVVKRSTSGATNKKKSFRSSVKSNKMASMDSGNNNDLSVVNSLPDDKDSLTAKLIPGSLGEMLLKKRFKMKFKKEVTLASKLSIFNKKEINCKDNNQKDNSKCEIVDLCHEEEEDDEDDELTLRIKALESAVKGRQSNQTGDASSLRTWSTLPDDWNESTFKQFKVGENMIYPDGITSPKSDSENDLENDGKEKAEEIKRNEVGVDINVEHASGNEVDLNVNKEELAGYSHQIQQVGHANKNKMNEENVDERSNKNESSTMPCELTSVDMDISNDSFSDSGAPVESNEIITNKNCSEEVNMELQHSKQNANFSIPIEWAYMMPPPPQPDQPANNLSSISNWCFNQNMYVQSMQDSVKDTSSTSSQPTWSSAEADQTTSATESYSNSYYFPPPTGSNDVQCDDIRNDQTEGYTYDCQQFEDSDQLTGELRDSHAEQYKSFMSSVMTHNCQSLGNKKEQHRDLVEIQLDPFIQTMKNITGKPEKKAIASKRRRRRRSSKRNGETAVTNILRENDNIENSENKNVVDDEDEDMLRALLLNDMTLKYKTKTQELGSSLDYQDSKSNSSGSDIATKAKSSKSITKSSLLPQNRFRKLANYNKERKNNWLTERKLSNVTIVKQISDVNKESFPFSMFKFPPVKPVIISFNNDSDSDEESEEEAHDSRFRNSDSVLSGIDSLIKSCRNKQSMSSSLKEDSPSRNQNSLSKNQSLIPSNQSFVSKKDEDQPTPETPVLHTPKGVTHLSKEKQLEYRRLKQLMIFKKKALQMKTKRNQCAKNISSSREGKENISVDNQVVEERMKGGKGDVCPSSPEDIQTSSSVDAQDKDENEDQSVENNNLTKGVFYTLKSFVTKLDILEGESKHETEQTSTKENKVMQGHNEILANLETVGEEVEQKEENINMESLIPITNSGEDNNNSVMTIIDDTISPTTEVMPIADRPVSPSKTSAKTSQPLTNEIDTDVEERVNNSKDTSDEDSSSSESESSSSSSEDSESESEEDKTEINLRNKLLQKRRELLLAKNIYHSGNKETFAQKFSEKLDDKDLICDSNLEQVEYVESAVSCPANVTEQLQDKDTSMSKSNCDIEADNKNIKSNMEINKETTVKRDSEMNYCKEICDEETSKEKKSTEVEDLSTCSQQKDICNLAEKNTVTPEKMQHSEATPFDKSIEESNVKVQVDNCNNINEIPILKGTSKTAKSVINSKSSLSNVSSLTKSASQLVSKEQSSSSQEWKQQETQTQQLVTKTFNKVKEEVINRLTSVKTMAFQISSLFSQAMSEDAQCQTKFTEIIKLLSEINTLRKERKGKTASISSNYFMITSLLQKLSDDMNYLNRLDVLVQKHYNAKDMTLLSTITKGKKEGESHRNRCLSEARKLKDAVQQLTKQEIILNKTFSKPLESASSKRESVGGTRSLVPKKRQYKLDNRVYKRQLGDFREGMVKLENIRESNLTVKANDVVPTSFSASGGKSFDAKVTKFVSIESRSPKIDGSERPENDKFAGDLVLCPYDLLGRCNDDQCIYHHMSAATGIVAGQVRSPVRSPIKNSICNSSKPVHVDKNPKKLDSNSLGSNDKAVISIEDSSERTVGSRDMENTSFSMEDFIIDTQGVKVEVEEEIQKHDDLSTSSDLHDRDCDISEDLKVNLKSEHVDINVGNSKCLVSNRRRCKKRKSNNYLDKTFKKRKSVDKVSLECGTNIIKEATTCEIGDTSDGPKSAFNVTTSENISCCEELGDATSTESDVTLSSPSTSKAVKRRRKTLPSSKQPQARKKRVTENTPLYIRVLRSSKRPTRH